MNLINVMKKVTSTLPNGEVEVLNCILVLVFCLFILLGDSLITNLSEHYHGYFSYYNPEVATAMIILVIIHLIVLRGKSLKRKAWRIISCRIMALFWVITSIIFTTHGWNTSFFTYLTLSVFMLITSFTLANEIDKTIIKDIKSREY